MNANCITIAQKMSGTGTIHDLASEFYDITIRMGTKYHYAVGAPSYYGTKWTRHETIEAAMRRYASLDGYDGVSIINRDGDVAKIDGFDGHYDVTGWGYGSDEIESTCEAVNV